MCTQLMHSKANNNWQSPVIAPGFKISAVHHKSKHLHVGTNFDLLHSVSISVTYD